MSKFKQGQKVWIYRYSQWQECAVCEEMVYEGTTLDGKFAFVRSKDMQNLTYQTKHVFKTKQECLDYIINGIEVINYIDWRN